MQEDDPILSQQYCCISWINPTTKREKEIAQQLLTFFQTRVNEPERLTHEKILEDFLDYKNMYYKEMSEQVESSVPYVKVRGVYKTLGQCVARIKQLEERHKDNEPVAIYNGYVGKWFPFIGSQEEVDNSDLADLLNKALWDYKEYVKENTHKFEQHKEETPTDYVGTPYDPNHDYLDEDEVNSKQIFFCVSFFAPREKERVELENLYIKEFVYFFLSEEFKARYSVNQETAPEYEETKDSLFDAFQETKQSVTTSFDSNGWPCFKLRGVYSSEDEAQKKGQYFQREDQDFRTDVCKVGCWLAFCPPGHLLKSHYPDEKLTDIMTGLNERPDEDIYKNLQKAEEEKKKAIEEAEVL